MVAFDYSQRGFYRPDERMDYLQSLRCATHFPPSQYARTERVMSPYKINDPAENLEYEGKDKYENTKC